MIRITLKRTAYDLARVGLVGVLAVGCTGGAGKSASAPSDDDGTVIPPADEIKLDRNPSHPLTCNDSKKVVTGSTPFVRLSATQYANTLRDLLAPLKMPGAPLPPDTLRPGFAPDDAFAAGTDVVEAVSSQATNLGTLVASNLDKLGLAGCPPANANAETACMDGFIKGFVTRAYRRPPSDDERKAIETLFANARKSGDFSQAIGTVVEGVLQTPQFLYRLEIGGGAQDGSAKLSGYEMASRLSYLLWNSMPDAELMTAAGEGALDDSKGIASQVQRMLKDERAKQMAGDFVDAWLHLDLRLSRAAGSAKDKTAFPNYSDAVSKDLVSGLDSFIEDSLLGDKGGIRKLLGSRSGWVNQNTAPIYGATSSGSQLTKIELNGDQRRGLLTQPALMAALANPEKHAPVRRGVLVLEGILCQSPPPPPNGMIPPQPAPDTSVKRTTRERLIAEHESQGGSCKSCHEVIDGAGFAFENYNAIGQWQDKEDGLDVNSSAVITGTYDADGNYKNAVEMIDRLAQSEQVAQCYTETFYRYAMARELTEDDGCNIGYLTDRVIKSDSDMASLIEALTTAPGFRYRSAF
ncbi:MAG: DUF1592 domain-containing protein [Deltaproteobacteria bacterium]|nr:DUF1592 domain-containing protein [Deltaproteobacteria bacterium]